MLRPGDARAADRCCFLVEAAVSGHAVTTEGADLERPGAHVYRARWHWNVRHVVRYVEHGRIFNALTAVRAGASRSRVSLRFAETSDSLRGRPCSSRLHRNAVVPGDRAYVSLEDGLAGGMMLVLRAHLRVFRPRCNASLVVPLAHLTRAPSGEVLRRSSTMSLGWREDVHLAGGRAAVKVRVRLRFIPESQARRLERVSVVQGCALPSASRLATRATKSSSGGGCSRPTSRSAESVARNER
jgi:hypothetical protein